MEETVVNVDGERRYLWNVMDAQTRFLLATHIRGRGASGTRAARSRRRRGRQRTAPRRS